MDNRKKCPYCGEEIALTAKKCRFCGEWIQTEEAILIPETVEAEAVGYAAPQQEMVVSDGSQGYGVPANVTINGMPQGMQNNPIAQYPNAQYPAQPNVMQNGQPFQQPVINIQLAQETNVENHQEVNVTTSGSSSSSGFLWFELFLVGGAVWWGTGHWWAGLITWVLLVIAMQIPYIGTAICWILGAGVGLFAGVVSAAFGAPVWACWLIGILGGLGAAALNVEDKDSDD